MYEFTSQRPINVTLSGWFKTFGHGSHAVHPEVQAIYLDGKLVASQAASGNITDGGEDIILGGVAASGNSTMNGLLDDLRIYNRALSTTEVKQLYSAGR